MTLEDSGCSRWPADLALVLLPGLDGTGLLFEPFLSEFPNPDCVKVVRYPGEACVDLPEMCELVREQLPSSGRFVLLAESFSGPIAARLLKHPGVAAAVFCASFLSPPRPFLLRFLSILPLSILFSCPKPDWAIEFACLGKNCPKMLLESVHRALKQVDTRVLAQRFRILANLEPISLPAELRIPIGYLRGTEDRLVPPSCERAFGPNALLIPINGPHFLLQRSASRAVDEVCRFARENIRADA